jgi:hypothetical protein
MDLLTAVMAHSGLGSEVCNCTSATASRSCGLGRIFGHYGVAFWILPRLPAGGGRGAVAPAWLAFIRLNAGLWLVALASVFSPSDAARVVGRLAEAVGAIAFGVHAWRRIRRAGIARIG